MSLQAPALLQYRDLPHNAVLALSIWRVGEAVPVSPPGRHHHAAVQQAGAPQNGGPEAAGLLAGQGGGHRMARGHTRQAARRAAGRDRVSAFVGIYCSTKANVSSTLCFKRFQERLHHVAATSMACPHWPRAASQMRWLLNARATTMLGACRRLERLLKRYRRAEMQRVEWLDRLALKEIERLQLQA